MKIDGFGSINTTNGTSATNKRKGVSSSSFADLLSAAEEPETSSTNAAQDIAATPMMGNLLALQEVPEEFLHRKKLVQQGHSMLITLEKLQQQLIQGSLTFQTLRNIEAEIEAQKQVVNDPKLSEIIADIELRAAVEAAKLRQYMRETW